MNICSQLCLSLQRCCYIECCVSTIYTYSSYCCKSSFLFKGFQLIPYTVCILFVNISHCVHQRRNNSEKHTNLHLSHCCTALACPNLRSIHWLNLLYRLPTGASTSAPPCSLTPWLPTPRPLIRVWRSLLCTAHRFWTGYAGQQSSVPASCVSLCVSCGSEWRSASAGLNTRLVDNGEGS